MSRLVLVSNRLPVTVRPSPSGLDVQRSVGGLATALRQPHERTGGLWVGWPGPTGDLDDAVRDELERRLAGLGTVPVHLTAEEVALYYGAFSNGVLWPLFHYVTGVLPLRLEGWAEYRAANERFADAVAARYRPGDRIWVHDYQLMLVPALLRRRLPEARIGFFLHIPFPSSEVFGTLPARRELLEGLLGADLVGFHTEGYRRHFASSVHALLGIPAPEGRIRHPGGETALGVFPIGIDAAEFAARADTPEVAAQARRLRGDEGIRLLVGIDRLDYTKGIPRRLLAFEDFLTRWPDWLGRVRLVQVAVPSRTDVHAYGAFRQEVDALVGRINGAFGTPHWMPVHYIFRSLSEDEISALYVAADAMLVTPVRDGMNLVAKEFVASRGDGDGVLVLSEFAGAAAQMREAVSVNPYDLAGTAEAYHRALTMPERERRARMAALRDSVFGYDVHRWVKTFLAELEASGAGRDPDRAGPCFPSD
jgi:trehalose 6-phosphate synthase/phosphatase